MLVRQSRFREHVARCLEDTSQIESSNVCMPVLHKQVATLFELYKKLHVLPTCKM
jgi:hypothetical protein